MTILRARTFALFALLLTLPTAPAFAQSVSVEDQQAVLNHRLTLDNIKKVFAADKDLLNLLITNPGLVDEAAKQPKPTGLDDSAKMLASFPEVAAVFKKHGMAARDYLLTSLAMTGTAFTYQFAAAGKMAEFPPGVQKDNLELWKTNLPKMKEAVDEWQKVRGELLKRMPK